MIIRYNKGVVSGISKDSDGYLYLWGGVEDKRQVKIFQREISIKVDVKTHLSVGAIDKITGIIEGKLENGERFVIGLSLKSKVSKFERLYNGERSDILLLTNSKFFNFVKFDNGVRSSIKLLFKFMFCK